MQTGIDREESPLLGGQPLPRAGLPVGPAIPPLNVTGLVVTKADLVAALRVYVAQLTDIAVLEGDRFLLSLAPPVRDERGDQNG